MNPNPPCRCESCVIGSLVAPGTFGPCTEPSNVKRVFTPFPKVHSYRGRAEQLGKYGSPNDRKFEKNRANRLRRRAERIDPENAPTRLIGGWND